MSGDKGKDFIQQLNQNLGIAHKVCRVYLQDADDRQDAFQEMMYQLWKSYSRFDGKAKFSTWMYSVCLHTALTYKRKSKTICSRRRPGPLDRRHHYTGHHPFVLCASHQG